MVGTGLSQLNNLLDVSRESIYHGLLWHFRKGELAKCAHSNTNLDNLAKGAVKRDQTFKDILENEFRPRWNEFRHLGLLMTSWGSWTRHRPRVPCVQSDGCVGIDTISTEGQTCAVIQVDSNNGI